jgi:hypothetical protein
MERRVARAPCCDGITAVMVYEVEGVRCGSRFTGGVRTVTEISGM